MSAQTTDCHSTRQALLDLALAGRAAGDPPWTAAEHLRSCTACEDYRRGLAPATVLRILPYAFSKILGTLPKAVGRTAAIASRTALLSREPT